MLMRLAVGAAVFAVGAAAQDAALDHFEKAVRPALAKSCYACHSGGSPQGNLNLATMQGIERVVKAGDPDGSLLMRAIRYQDANLLMPPGGPLPAEVVAEFETWIRAGAPLPAAKPAPQAKLWSLERPRKSEPPQVSNTGWARNEIDRFVLGRLEKEGLKPSPEATKETLIRRASFDLTGFTASRPRSNCSVNWTPNLPAWAHRTFPTTGPTPTMSMVIAMPGATG